MVVNIDAEFPAFLSSGDLREVCDAVLGLDSAGSGGFGGRGGRGGRGRDRGGRGRGGFRGGDGGGGGYAGGRGGGAAQFTTLRPAHLAELRRRLNGANIVTTHNKASKRIEKFKGLHPKHAVT